LKPISAIKTAACALGFGEDQRVAIVKPSGRGHLRKDTPRLFLLALTNQEAKRFRQFPQDERQQNQRYGGNEEHRLPAILRNEADAETSRHHAADGIAEEHQCDHGAAQALRRIFVHQRRGVRRH
jgi:hypothetical protein